MCRKVYWHHQRGEIAEDYEFTKEKERGLFVWVDCPGFPRTLAPVSSLTLACNATDGGQGDPLYGTCDLPEGHEGRYHRELLDDGKLWAGWSGDSRTPYP